MFLCTITGKFKPKLDGNEIARGLTNEYIHIDMKSLPANASLVFASLIADLKDCINYPHGFGSNFHITAIKEIRTLLSSKDLYEQDQA